MRFTINLATRRYLNTRLLNALLIASFAILALLLVLAVREVAYNQAELTRIRNLEATAGSRPGAPPVSQAQMQALSARIGFANTLIREKSVDWLGLLDRFEDVVPAGVALTQIEPSKQDQGVRVSGVAHGFPELRAFLENMEQSPNFSQVFLLSQNEQKVGLTQEGLGFSISCKVRY